MYLASPLPSSLVQVTIPTSLTPDNGHSLSLLFLLQSSQPPSLLHTWPGCSLDMSTCLKPQKVLEGWHSFLSLAWGIWLLPTSVSFLLLLPMPSSLGNLSPVPSSPAEFCSTVPFAWNSSHPLCWVNSHSPARPVLDVFSWKFSLTSSYQAKLYVPAV